MLIVPNSDVAGGRKCRAHRHHGGQHDAHGVPHELTAMLVSTALRARPEAAHLARERVAAVGHRRELVLSAIYLLICVILFPWMPTPAINPCWPKMKA